MSFFLAKTPNWVEEVFTSLMWTVKTRKKEVYLTFDDGPSEITEWVLYQLKKYNAKATFFCVGKNIAANPIIFKRTLYQGHNIGNHTYNHLNGWKVNSKLYLENILKTEGIFQKYQFYNTNKIFRPPYGRIKKSQIRKLKKENYQIVMWSVLSGDFDDKTKPEVCVKNVLKNVKKGAIIVFHDSTKSYVKLKYALPKVLESLKKQGYQFKAL